MMRSLFLQRRRKLTAWNRLPAKLSVQYDQIFSAVGNNTQGITDAKDLANKAYECGVYSQSNTVKPLIVEFMGFQTGV